MISASLNPATLRVLLSAIILIAQICSAQSVTLSREAERTGLPWDWSHEHVIFGQTTDTKVLAVIERDPRFVHQQLRRGQRPLQPTSGTIRNSNSFFAYLKPGGTKEDEVLSQPPGSMSYSSRPAAVLNPSLSLRARRPSSQRPSSMPRASSRVTVAITAMVIAGFPIALSRRRWRIPILSILVTALFLIITNCSRVERTSLTTETQTLLGDWGANIGPQSSITNINANNAPPMYPAKYSLDITQNPSCTNDFAVFPTGAKGTNSGGSATPSIIGFNQLYSSQGGNLPAGYCGTAGPSVAWAYLNVTCATSTTQSQDQILSSPVLSLDGTKVAWVTSDGLVQILTIGTVGNNGSSASGAVCIENAPGQTGTSPNNAVLNSLKLANVKHNPPNVSLSEIWVDYTTDSAYVGDDDGYLHKITPFFTATAALQEQTTPAWQPSHAYLVGNLILDNNGFIQKCTTAGTSGTGGQPGWNKVWGQTTSDNTVTWTNEGSGGGWPVYVTGVSNQPDNVKLAGPVYDVVSKNVFVGDTNGSLYYVLDSGASSPVGSCANGLTLLPCLGTPGTASSIASGGGAQHDCSTATPHVTCMVASNQSNSFTDPVIVDSANSLVITQFSNADNSHAMVAQTNTSLSVFNSVNLAPQKNQSNHIGTFDNTYYSTPANGYFYVCSPNSSGNAMDLYRVSFTNNSGTIALGSVNGTPFAITVNTANCSGLTEIYNTATSTDWLFLSVDNQGVTPTCNGHSCVMSFTLGSSMVNSVNASYAGSTNLNGTGGIIVDSVADTTTFPQASSIYFTPVANNLSCGDGSSNTACAIKLTQSGLQ